MIPQKFIKSILFGLVAVSSIYSQAAEQIGVSKDQIVVGTLQDFSGPIASYGRQVRNGMLMRADEINESGGVYGRRIKIMFEDMAYDQKKALLATQKLVQQDKIFAMIGSLGAGPNVVSMPILLENGVLNLFPVAAAREMYEPLHKLKYSIGSTYAIQIRSALKWMAKERGAKKFCLIYQDDELGTEVNKGADEALKELGLTLVEKTSYKRGATDFSAQVARMQGSACDTVVLGTALRETVGVIVAARKVGWDPQFFGSSTVYNELIPKLGGKGVDGLYGVATVQVPYADDPSKNVREWIAKYKAKYSEEPGLYSVYAYSVMDLFYQTAKKAGPNLTTDKFVNALENSTFSRDMFGSPEYSFSPQRHLGNAKGRITQLQNGRWVTLTDFID